MKTKADPNVRHRSRMSRVAMVTLSKVELSDPTCYRSPAAQQRASGSLASFSRSFNFTPSDYVVSELAACPDADPGLL